MSSIIERNKKYWIKEEEKSKKEEKKCSENSEYIPILIPKFHTKLTFHTRVDQKFSHIEW